MHGGSMIREYGSVGMALLVLAVVATMAGCGGGGGGGGGGSAADATVPVIVQFSATSPTGPSTNNITVEVIATDNVGVTSVNILLTKPDGTQVILPMTPLSDGRYSVTYQAEANTTQIEKVYTFTVRATDAAGNVTTAGPGTVKVPPLVNPPLPPF